MRSRRSCAMPAPARRCCGSRRGAAPRTRGDPLRASGAARDDEMDRPAAAAPSYSRGRAVTRARLVVGNWKMNPSTIAEAVALSRAVVSAAPAGETTVAVAPPAVALAAVADAVRGTGVLVYAQDVHWEDKGAYTGGIAASMLAGV